MSLRIRRSISFNGTSTVRMTVDGKDQTVQAAYMSASIGDNGEMNINKAISNRDAYEENRDEVKQDFADFEDAVEEAFDSTKS